MKAPAYVKVVVTDHNPECWLLPVGSRSVCWRFWPPRRDAKVPHGPFVTFEGSPHGPVSADDMAHLAEVATVVEERLRADRWRGDGSTIFDLEGAS